MKIRPDADVIVTAFASDPGFLDSTLRCRFKTHGFELDQIFTDGMASQIKLQTQLGEINPKSSDPYWWTTSNPQGKIWLSKDIIHEGDFFQYIVVENADGYIILGTFGTF